MKNKIPSPTPIPEGNPRKAAEWFLAASLVLMGFLRLRSFFDPLERDLTTYALMGDGWIRGLKLYSELWDNKPPGTYAVFAAAQWFEGFGPKEILFLNLLFGGFILIGVFVFAARTTGSSRAGGLAAFLWALFGSSPDLHANQPYIELFLNAIWTWTAFAALWVNPFRTGYGAILGSLAALGVLLKPVGMIFPALLIPLAPFFGGALRRERLEYFTYAAAGFAVPLLLVAGALLFAGIGGTFWDEVVRSGALYIGMTPKTVPWRLLFLSSPLWPLAALFIGTWAGVRRVAPYSRWILAVWVLAGMAAVFAQGLFTPHHFQLLMIPLLIGTAWGLESAWVYLDQKKIPGYLPVLLTGVFLAAVQYPVWCLGPAERSIRQYGTDDFVQSRDLGVYLGRVLGKGETFYEWGNETGLYFYSGHRPPSGIFFTYAFSFSPDPGRLKAVLQKDLYVRPPELVVVGLKCLSQNPALWEDVLGSWVAENYVPWSVLPRWGSFQLLVRKGGKLERRVVPSPPPDPSGSAGT